MAGLKWRRHVSSLIAIDCTSTYSVTNRSGTMRYANIDEVYIPFSGLEITTQDLHLAMSIRCLVPIYYTDSEKISLRSPLLSLTGYHLWPSFFSYTVP